MRTVKKRTFTGTKDPSVTPRELANRDLARKAATEGIVLLKNEKNILPLEKGSKVALYGIGASRTIKGGTGSGDVNERDSVSVYQGLLNAGFDVTTGAWIESYEKQFISARNAWRDDILERVNKAESGVFAFFDIYTSTPFIMPVGDPVEKTDTDTAIYVLSRIAGEGADRYNKGGDYILSEEENVFLKSVCDNYKQVILVINAGGVSDLSFLDKYDNIYGLINMMQAGMEGGNALADILLGEAVPSGKLTDSWAFNYSDYPGSDNFSHNNGNLDKEYYNEGIYVGYRYFDTFDIPVRYGFGYGLSYTTFDISCLGGEYEDETITLSVKVKNTGDRFAGKEVIQVYATCPAENQDKEYRRLAGFKKTSVINPGQEEILKIEVPVKTLTSYYEASASWMLDEGNYILSIGNSLSTAYPAVIARLDADVAVIKTKNICPPQEKFDELKPDRAASSAKREALLKRAEEAEAFVVDIAAASVKSSTVAYKANAELISPQAKAFVDTLTDEELVALASGDPYKGQGSNLGSAGITVPGSAGETNDCCLEKGLASIVLSDGPAGLRLQKFYNVDKGQIVPVPFQAALEGGIFCPDLADSLPGERYYQYCTAIPVGTLLAQTWNTDLIKELGEMIGKEMELFDTTLWLAPGMNIHRNPLCGRNFEYYSEDPFISGKMAAAMTDGVQRVPGCGTTIKHFACNNQEDNRMGVDSILRERALREIYLKGFEMAVTEAQPMSIMTSYNLINGIHSANNYDICTNAARCEWGFKGVIMTDWTTTENGPDCTASGCMRAGNDLVMPGAMSDRENLTRELSDGSLPKADLKACIARLVNIVWQSNMYE